MSQNLKKELYKLIKKDDKVLDFIQKGPMDGLLFLNLEESGQIWMADYLWEILGYDGTNIPADWYGIIYIEDLILLQDKILATGKGVLDSFMLELRFNHKDGHCVTMKCRNLLVKKQKSKARRMIGALQISAASTDNQSHSLTDIQKLQESEEKYKAMYNNAPLAFQSLDSEGYIKEINPQWKKTLGYENEDILNHWFGDFLHPDFVEHFRKNFPRFKQQGFINDVRFKMRKKNGEYIYVSFEGCIGYTPEGDFRQTYCTFKDITIETIAHNKLEESEEKLRLAINNSPLGVCILNKKGGFITVNKAFQKIVGYSEQELKSLTFFDITHSDYITKNQNFFDEIIENKSSSFSIEKKYIRKDDSLVDVRLHLGTISDKDDDSAYAMTFVEDITWQKKFEAELIAAKDKAEESNRLKTEFLHNMSHEIRTPMNGIVGFSEMLGNEDISAEKRHYFTSIIQNSSHQLLRIIDDILDISILETKQVKINKNSLHINEFVLELFSIFDYKAKERRIPIYLKNGLGQKDRCITTDVSKLQKILSNLLENALKFTREGFVELAYYQEGENLIFAVKDTGIGISKKNTERIFQRFSQESKDIAHSHGGLGLGLSIAKENAQLLGGDIWLESTKGEGATFFVSLPFLPEDMLEQATEDKKTKLSHQNGTENTVLIAEDEEINLLYLETILSDMDDLDLKLIHAKNGKEAVDLVQENPHISLILMDIKMPIMNGYEAALKIKVDFPNIPIIAETAYSTESDNDYALTHGCDEFISKPIDRQALYMLIRKYLK